MMDADLRARMVALHGADRVARAEARALFTSALGVYQLASERREAAQEALLAAAEAENEWGQITHGLALAYAVTIDRDLAGIGRGAHHQQTPTTTELWESIEGGNPIGAQRRSTLER